MSAELRVLCEGLTEQNFVTQVLAPHLRPFDVFSRAESLLRGHGGVVPFNVLRKAIKSDVGRSRDHQFVTTMIDLYALPEFPGAEKVHGESVMQRVSRIESGMAEALPNPRFIPYVQVHEFEALVFVDLDALPREFPDGEAAGAPDRLRSQIGAMTPEEINDGGDTAPSKRLIGEVSAYRYLKPIAGPAVAGRIGIAKLRAACPHFDWWVTRLEALALPPRQP